jgi:hypothetical protein
MNPGVPQRRALACREFVAAQTMSDKSGKKGPLNPQKLARKLAKWKEFEQKLEQAFATTASA